MVSSMVGHLRAYPFPALNGPLPPPDAGVLFGLGPVQFKLTPLFYQRPTKQLETPVLESG